MPLSPDSSLLDIPDSGKNHLWLVLQSVGIVLSLPGWDKRDLGEKVCMDENLQST